MEENLDFVEKKSKGKIVAIICLILGIILLIGGGVYYLFFSSLTPDKYLNKVSNNLNTYVKDVFTSFPKNNTDKKNKESKQTGNITINTNNESLKFLDDYKINYTLTTSLAKEEINLNLNLLEKENSLLNGTFSLNKESLYLKAEELYPKTLRIGSFNENIFSILQNMQEENYTISDIETVFESYVKYYFEALKEADLKMENVSVTEIKYTYKFTKNNISKIENKFQELCEQDTNLKNIFKDSDKKYEITLEEGVIELVINRFNKDIISYKSDFNDYKITIEKTNDNEYKLEQTNSNNQKNKGKLTIKDKKIVLEEYNDEEIETTYKFESKNGTTTLNISDKEMEMEFSLKKVDNNDLRVSIKIDDKKGNTTVDLDGDIKTGNDTFEYKFLVDFQYDDEKINLTLDATTTYGENLLEESDYSDAVDYETLSEEEKNSIMEKLVTKLLESSLFKNLLGSDSAL